MRKKWECFVKWIREYGVYLVFVIVVFILVVDIFILYFSTFEFTLGDNKGDWGTFGDFVGGTLNPILSFFGFMAVLYTIAIQRKELKRTEATQKRQQFENTFFELLKVHNEVLYRKSDVDIKGIKSRVFSPSCYSNLIDANKARHEAKNKLKSENNFCKHYFRVLYQLLKFIAINSENGIDENFRIEDIEKNDISVNEKMYSNIVRALLTNDLMKLLAVNCYCEHKENDVDWQYNLLIKRYSFF